MRERGPWFEALEGAVGNALRRAAEGEGWIMSWTTVEREGVQTIREEQLLPMLEDAAGVFEDRDVLADAVTVLRDALAFYASVNEVNAVSLLLSDCGERAREAIARLQTVEEPNSQSVPRP